jgi:DNA-binding transcriptional MerR regulator
MFKIGDFSRLCRVSVSTLRYYADMGLLPPAQVDEFTGYRYFSLEQLPRLHRILALRDLNLSLEQIAQLLDENLDVAEMRGMLRLKRVEIEQCIAEEQARLDRVAARLEQIDQEGNMSAHEVVLKPVEPQRVMALRTIIPKPEDVATLFMAAYPALMQRGIQPSSAPFTMFYDPEFKQENMDVEIAFPVASSVTEPITLEDGRAFRIYDLEGIHAASLVYEGGFDSLEEPYTAIGRWIENNGFQISGVPREIYLRPPSQGTPPLTEIQYPVKKA